LGGPGTRDRDTVYKIGLPVDIEILWAAQVPEIDTWGGRGTKGRDTLYQIGLAAEIEILWVAQVREVEILCTK
jgi:hypothetical protein